MMTDEEKLAYGKGYNAGRNNQWPNHKPPSPPNEIVAELVKASTGLRNCIDDFAATLDDTDPFAVEAGEHIDAVDVAMEKITKWLMEGE